MPKPGFKSITVSQSAYDSLMKDWEKVKPKLILQGITTFSAYILYRLSRSEK